VAVLATGHLQQQIGSRPDTRASVVQGSRVRPH
jgi:hypothetical protein